MLRKHWCLLSTCPVTLRVLPTFQGYFRFKSYRGQCSKNSLKVLKIKSNGQRSVSCYRAATEQLDPSQLRRKQDPRSLSFKCALCFFFGSTIVLAQDSELSSAVPTFFCPSFTWLLNCWPEQLRFPPCRQSRCKMCVSSFHTMIAYRFWKETKGAEWPSWLLLPGCNVVRCVLVTLPMWGS